MTGVATDQLLAAIAAGGGGGGGSASWDTLAGKPEYVAAGDTAADARSAIGAGTSDLAVGTSATDAKAGNYQPTWSQVSGKPTEFAPAAHDHAIADLETTGTASATTYLAGDGAWKTPANTTYTVIADAEATAGTATTARAVSAASLARDVPKFAVSSPDDSVSTVQFVNAVEDIPGNAPEGSVWLTVTGA